MSKCYANWMRLPNSRMDRQYRPKQFFRQKERVQIAHEKKLESKEMTILGFEELEAMARRQNAIEDDIRLICEKTGMDEFTARAILQYPEDNEEVKE